MKYPCNLIRDIMPLYYDKACSMESSMAVEEHMKECPECKDYYKTINNMDFIEDIVFDEQKELRASNSLKQIRRKMKIRSVLTGIGAMIAGIVMVMLVMAIRIGLPSMLLLWSAESAEIEVHTDIAEYDKYMSGAAAEKNYRTKWGMDESIFPVEITSDMEVSDYKMVYYNTWDAQYLGYLVVSYNDSDYAEEVKRLTNYASTDYLGYYGVVGFAEEYSLLAMSADPYYGFVYALTDNENTIIYVEMIFCNYFMDLDYSKYIPQNYLPIGFDATSENEYRQKMIG